MTGRQSENLFTGLEFKGILSVLDETGRLLDSNTEPKDGRNARLTIQMPPSGRVRVMVGSYEPQTTGRYRLAVVETGSR